MEKQNYGILQDEIGVYVGSEVFPDRRILALKTPKKDLLSILYDVTNGSAILARQARVYINGHFIPKQNLELVCPKCDVDIRFLPMGSGGGGDSKNPIATVLSIAAIAIAPAIGGVLAGAFGVSASATIIGGLTYGKLFTGLVTVASNLLISAIAPPPKPKLNSLSPLSSQRSESSPTYFIQGAKNDTRPFGVVPLVVGTHRLVPPQAASPFTESSNFGKDQYVRQLFTWGYGSDIDIADEKIGDTPLSNFQNVDSQSVLDGDSTSEIDIYPDIVQQDDYSVALKESDPSTVRRSPPNVDEIEIDISFPRGLTEIKDNGALKTRDVDISIDFENVDTGATISGGTINASAATTSSYRISERYKVPKGTYDVTLSRTSPPDTTDTQILDETFLTAIKGFTFGSPVQLDNINLTAIRMQASEQLNGIIDQYNAVVTNKIKDWNGSSWVDNQVTSNPASWYRYVLQSPANANPLNDDQIDLNALQDWHEYCDQRGFTCNGVIDYEATVLQVLQDIAASGRAQLTIRDGKYSVVVDKQKTDIVQHVTPRNSFDYSLEIAYPELPHAFRVQFINAEKGYLQDERIVYDDGYDESNATIFERLELPFITTPELAWIHGRENIAQVRLRRFTHFFSMDIENLIAERGDLIRFTHDVILQGVGSARIKSLTDDGTNVTAIELDDIFSMEAGQDYAIRVRKSDGTSAYYPIDTVAGENTSVTLTTPALIANAPEVGDLVMMGEAGTESRELIIQEISPSNDFVAQIKAVDYAPDIFNAADGDIPDFESNVTLPEEFKRPFAPILQNIQSDEDVQVINLDGSISNRMIITLVNQNASDVSTIVQVREAGTGQFLNADVSEKTPERIVITGLSANQTYDFKIYYRKENSLSGLGSNTVSEPLSLNGVTFFGTSAPPPDVENFDITVRSESVFLSWDEVDVVDLKRYEIRFNASTTGATWENSIPIITNISKESTSYTAFSKVGTYLIKAVDVNGIYSENAALAETNIGEIQGLNFIKTIDESADWGGTFDNTFITSAGNLELSGSDEIDDWIAVDDIESWDYGADGVASSGVYYFENTEDLGEVYTSVLSADINVQGNLVFDKIDEWGDIDGRQSWDGTNISEYSAKIEVRKTDDDPSASPTWSAWKPFIIGEYTARAFEFRVVLTANISDITPSVSLLNVEIDMPDRISSSDDITVPAAGDTINYSGGAFRVAPAIAISADDMDTGDYYKITNKTASSFDIRFFDSGGSGVERTFSYVAKGYGKVL